MEGMWLVQQITLYWTFTTSANIIFCNVFFSFFWHFEVHNWIPHKLLTNFELTPISISFSPLFQFYYLPFLPFWLVFKVLKSFFCVGYCKTWSCDDFFLHLTTSQKFYKLMGIQPIFGVCLLKNHSGRRDWITDKYWSLLLVLNN